MANQELPEVSSVWRHNETGEIREVVAVDFASITFDTAGGLTRKVTTHFDWRGWKRNATRLSPAPPVDVAALEPAEVFRIKSELAKVEVFGPWEQVSGQDWVRPDAGRPHDSRVCVWGGGGEFHWEIGFDVIAITRVLSEAPFPTLSAAQAACDAVLRERGVLLVD